MRCWPCRICRTRGTPRSERRSDPCQPAAHHTALTLRRFASGPRHSAPASSFQSRRTLPRRGIRIANGSLARTRTSLVTVSRPVTRRTSQARLHAHCSYQYAPGAGGYASWKRSIRHRDEQDI